MRRRRHAGQRTAHTHDRGMRDQCWTRVTGTRVMTVFLIAFIMLTALASGGLWSSASASVPERIQLDDSAPYGNDPVTAFAWDWRKEMGIRRDGFNPLLNVAVAFVDVTGKTAEELNVSKRNLADVESLRTANPGLYAAINPGPGVRTLLRVVRSNANKVQYAGSNGFHSEQRIYSFLDERGISHDKVLLLYSDRNPCKKRCSPLISPNTRVLFTALNFRDFRAFPGDLTGRW